MVHGRLSVHPERQQQSQQDHATRSGDRDLFRRRHGHGQLARCKKHRVRYISQAQPDVGPDRGRARQSRDQDRDIAGTCASRRTTLAIERPIAGNYILVYDRSGNLSGQPAELWTYNLPINTVLGTTTNLGAFVTDRWRLGRTADVERGHSLGQAVVVRSRAVQGAGPVRQLGLLSTRRRREPDGASRHDSPPRTT